MPCLCQPDSPTSAVVPPVPPVPPTLPAVVPPDSPAPMLPCGCPPDSPTSVVVVPPVPPTLPAVVPPDSPGPPGSPNLAPANGVRRALVRRRSPSPESESEIPEPGVVVYTHGSPDPHGDMAGCIPGSIMWYLRLDRD